jgi:predicted methyltransferase
MIRRSARLLLPCLLIVVLAVSSGLAQQTDAPGEKQERRPRENAQQRAESLRALAERLGVGAGSVIADIGAGKGRDTWTFAGIVGEEGKVYAEEITEANTKSIEEGVKERDLKQVHVVLGTPTDPSLPPNSVDMAFMHHVYHHVSKPCEMLKGIWQSLKPGGHFVIVDQRLGTLVDWVPREDRAKKHFWIAETTVVREARENGFMFVEYAEECWHVKNSFVLVFQRPADLDAPDRDPDPPLAIAPNAVQHLLTPSGDAYQRVAFIALGEGRKLTAPFLQASPCDAVDIVLEEWATQKGERPPLPAEVTLPSVLTEKGDPGLDPEPLDAVFFLDTYHLLFHGPTLLAKLRERLTDRGVVCVLDRQAPKPISHREASHRRMIAPETVKQEFAQAGFSLSREGPRPAEDRFLLFFAKADDAEQTGNGSD